MCKATDNSLPVSRWGALVAEFSHYVTLLIALSPKLSQEDIVAGYPKGTRIVHRRVIHGGEHVATTLK